MVIFEKNKDKIGSKYTLKRTKLHCFKKISRGSIPPNSPCFVTCRFPNLKKILGSPPSQILGTPLIGVYITPA